MVARLTVGRPQLGVQKLDPWPRELGARRYAIDCQSLLLVIRGRRLIASRHTHLERVLWFRVNGWHCDWIELFVAISFGDSRS